MYRKNCYHKNIPVLCLKSIYMYAVHITAVQSESNTKLRTTPLTATNVNVSG